MHAADYHQRVTDDITSIRANYVRPRWTDLESRRLAMVEISIITKKPDSKRFPINKQIMQQFKGKTLTAIKTHRASSKYKALVRTLLTNDDVLKSNTTNTLPTDTNILCDLEVTSSTAHDLHITAPPTHNLDNTSFTTYDIDTTLLDPNTYNPNDELNTENDTTEYDTDTRLTYNLNTVESSQQINNDSNMTDLDLNIRENKRIPNKIHTDKSINSTWIHLNRNVNNNNLMQSITINSLPDNNQHNNLNRIKLILLQYIIENNNTNIQLLPQLLHMVQNFIHYDIQKIIDLDHEHLINSSNINIGKKIVETIYKDPAIRKVKVNSVQKKLSNKTIKRRRRRLLYAKTQYMFNKNRANLARAIFDGVDITYIKDEFSIEAQFNYWSNLFKSESIKFNREFNNTTRDNTEPITLKEITDNYNTLNDGAPGSDLIKKDNITKIGLDNLCLRFNIYLLTSTAPSCYKKGLTTLIPKCKKPSDPSQFRPITLSSILCRLFHKIIARRIEASIKLDIRQKAFTRRDGIAENIFLLKNIIYQHKQKLKPLSLCFLDVSKAFDSVSHNALIKLCNRVGIPETLVNYVKHAYDGCSTNLKYKSGVSIRIPVNSGVKQGDPMSPLLFNSVIDYVTSELKDYNAISINDNTHILKYMAFADDLVIFGKDEACLQNQINIIMSGLKECGLNINHGKCATMNLIIHPTKKMWICSPQPIIKINNAHIKTISIDETYKYLGIPIGPIDNRNNNIVNNITAKLINISKALLKPQQRMHILKYHLIPSILHQMVFTNITLSSLKTIDRRFRSFVRRWMRLPKDTNLAVFHAPASVGGLSLPRLYLSIPVLRLNRIKSIKSNDDPLITSMPNNIIMKWGQPRYYENELFTSNISIRDFHIDKLFNSADGRGLKFGGCTKYVNRWIEYTNRLMSGRDYIDSFKLKHNLLYTKYRAKRMFPDTNTNCLMKGCNYKYDHLNHIMQTCNYNYNSRIHRHNYINKLLIQYLNKHNYITILEPYIRTTNGLRKPDILTYKINSDTAYIIDTQISTDTIDINANYIQKTSYYNTPDITDYAKRVTNRTKVVFSSSCWNWRGVPSTLSANDLLAIGLTKKEIEMLSIRTLAGGLDLYRNYCRHGLM